MTPEGIGRIPGTSVRPGTPHGPGQQKIDGAPLPQRGTLPGIRDGARVNGFVASLQEDGSYLVRIAGQNLLARANLPLLAGQHFQGIWDASGEIPVLRLLEGETALLASLSPSDREMASALLSRGLPLDKGALAALKNALTAAGGKGLSPGILAELWARGLPLTAENASVLSWYLSRDKKEISVLWKQIREEIRTRARRGENPLDVLRELLEGGDEKGMFLRGQSLLSRPSREGVDPSLLAPAFLPAGGGEDPLLARLSARIHSKGERTFWSLSFGMEGEELGSVWGEAESDGRSLAVSLRAEGEETFEALRSKYGEFRRELEGLSLVLQSLVIARGERVRPPVTGGLDITV